MAVRKQVRVRKSPLVILTPDNLSRGIVTLFTVILALLVLLTFGVPIPKKIASLSATRSAPVALSEADVKHIASFINTLRVDDPLITLASGVQVKRSNYYGITLGGATYYYNIWPHQSFGPLGRGEVPPEKVNILYQETSDPKFSFTIYTIQK